MLPRLGLLWGSLAAATLVAGPYSPGPELVGSVAIDAFEDADMTLENPELVAWANAFLNYLPGPNVSQTWQTPLGALGPSDDTGYTVNTTTIVTLGDGGSITLSFARPILDTDGFDLVVFENGISTTASRGFFELAFVEVSTDGIMFLRFPAGPPKPCQEGLEGKLPQDRENGVR